MNSLLEFLVSFFLNTSAFDSSSLFRVKTNLSEKESHRPGDQACQRLSKPSEHPGSRLLETPSQTDGGSVRGGKKGSVLVISMMSFKEEARRLCRALDSRCAFGLGALPGFPVASERKCVSHSLRNATPKAEVWTYFTSKGVTAPPYYWNISFVSLSFLEAINPTDTQNFLWDRMCY